MKRGHARVDPAVVAVVVGSAVTAVDTAAIAAAVASVGIVVVVVRDVAANRAGKFVSH